MTLEKILLILLAVETCFASSENKLGYCIVNYTVPVSHLEPYTYSRIIYKKEFCGWRHCTKPKTEWERGFRTVYRDDPRSRIECCPSYMKTMIHEDNFACEPICEPECEQGHCVSPGNCACLHGYVHETNYKCIPSCEPKCANGICSAPNICECFDGYTKENETHCLPHCSSPCVNGICIAPNECICSTGYLKNPDNWSICDPVCEKPCINSTCVGLNECKCFEGYIQVAPNLCIPYCSLECMNGDCSAPETCTCHDSYTLGNDTWNICLPDCNCTLGYCNEPNKCECYEHYTFNEESGDCEPICNGCVHSICAAPYICECLGGYKKLNDTVCVPECFDCTNGECTEPEVCTCYDGYKNTYGSCEPVCNLGCANGVCKSPNVCECESEDQHIEDNLCFPVCGSTNATSLERDCLTPERGMAKIRNSQEVINIQLEIILKINCSLLQEINNETCDFESCERRYCTGLKFECAAIKDKNGFKLLCFPKFANSSFEDTYAESQVEIAYIENLSTIDKTVETTILLPQKLMTGEEFCHLCLCSSDKSWDEINKITLSFLPCSPTSHLYINNKAGGVSLSFIWIAVAIAALALIAAGILYLITSHKIHEYIVPQNESDGCDDRCDEPILIQETEQ